MVGKYDTARLNLMARHGAALRVRMNAMFWYDAGGGGDCGPLTMRALIRYYLNQEVSVKQLRDRFSPEINGLSGDGRWWKGRHMNDCARAYGLKLGILGGVTANEPTGLDASWNGEAKSKIEVFAVNIGNYHWVPAFDKHLAPAAAQRLALTGPQHRPTKVKSHQEQPRPVMKPKVHVVYISDEESPPPVRRRAPTTPAKPQSPPKRNTTFATKATAVRKAAPKKAAPAKVVTKVAPKKAATKKVTKAVPMGPCPEGFYWRRGYTITMPPMCVARPKSRRISAAAK